VRTASRRCTRSAAWRTCGGGRARGRSLRRPVDRDRPLRPARGGRRRPVPGRVGRRAARPVG
jgi:hypothetical protein